MPQHDPQSLFDRTFIIPSHLAIRTPYSYSVDPVSRMHFPGPDPGEDAGTDRARFPPIQDRDPEGWVASPVVSPIDSEPPVGVEATAASGPGWVEPVSLVPVVYPVQPDPQMGKGGRGVYRLEF